MNIRPELQAVNTKRQMDSNNKDRKQRLNKMRERTKVLLRNHDWERFFAPSSDLRPTAASNESSSNEIAAMTNHHLNCSLSAINHLDYDSLLMQTNINQANTVKAVNQTPNNKLQSIHLMPFLVNTTSSQQAISRDNMKIVKTRKTTSKPKKAKTTNSNGGNQDAEDDAYYQLNTIPCGIPPSMLFKTPQSGRNPSTASIHHHHRHHIHHQSLTFIADLAQTSTPTRTSNQPITSTPKQLTHDPLKYHPTQTIRSKKPTATVTKPQPPTTMISSAVRMSLRRGHCMECVVATTATKTTRRKRKRTDSLSIVANQSDWACNMCNFSRAVSSIGDAAVMTAQVASTSKKRSHVKFKVSSIDISLQDLLYTPSKSNKFDLVTTSRPRVKKQRSKVYYL